MIGDPPLRPRQDDARRAFLFLQGPLSPLYARIADRLEAEGHAVHRINLNVGDALHWRRGGAVLYRGRLTHWPDFVGRFLRERRITDLVLHGDQRPYHQAAIGQAKDAGIRVLVTELGYLRPDWMTLERDATGSGSHFPRDPDVIRALAGDLTEPDLNRLYPAHFSWVAVPDVVYNMAQTILWPLYPHYRRHTVYYPPLEYAAWIWRLLTARRRDGQASRAAGRMISRATSVFVVPLQLEGDFQIRAHSGFAGQSGAIERLVASFARCAPAESTLLFKSHPLDNGLEGWSRVIARLAKEHDVSPRVAFLDGGTLEPLYARAAGVVTINSTAGLEAVMAGLPVKTLAPTIYDVPGLTFQGPLDRFWHEASRPETGLARAFIKALAALTQVRGTIYSAQGLEAAVANMAERILAMGQDASPVPTTSARFSPVSQGSAAATRQLHGTAAQLRA